MCVTNCVARLIEHVKPLSRGESPDGYGDETSKLKIEFPEHIPETTVY